MANSFNISDAPDIAANLVQILSNASALGTIQVTDLPAIVNEINANQVFIEAIIDTHLPGIITEIEANKTEIDKLVAALSMSPKIGYNTIAAVQTDAWAEALSITGAGYLHFVTKRKDARK
ncbi:MAG: hypothetical protein GH151_04155 [Bacteroidetes bacterium]|nr:hypothetical protein [Bacteroidota bacterium]